MLADDQGSPPCLCPGTCQVQESMCRSQGPGQNAANSSSWEKACGTHPAGWERPQASTETPWLKGSGSSSFFFVALENSCRRQSGGEGRLLLALLLNSVLVFWELESASSTIEVGKEAAPTPSGTQKSLCPPMCSPMSSLRPSPGQHGSLVLMGTNLPQCR